MKKKGQSAVEFLIIIGAVLFFFITFLASVQFNIGDKIKEKGTLETKEIALTIQDEINLALESSDGYSRQFDLPPNILGLGYQINIIEGLIYVRTDDGRYAIVLPVVNVTGQAQSGTNTIQKQNGEILINQ